MKKKYFWLQMIAGFVFFLGGLLIYGLGKLNMLGVQPAGAGVLWISIVGIVFIISATCDNFFKKTKQQEIEEKDERNIAIAHRAKSNAFNTMTVLFAVALVVLSSTGHLDTVPFFIMLGVFFVVQIVFVISLWYYQKKM